MLWRVFYTLRYIIHFLLHYLFKPQSLLRIHNYGCHRSTVLFFGRSGVTQYNGDANILFVPLCDPESTHTYKPRNRIARIVIQMRIDPTATEVQASDQRASRSLRSEEHTSELQSLRHLVC